MEWKPISLQDKLCVDDALKKNPISLSDYSFTNLWIWNSPRHYQIATVDDLLCIKFVGDGKQTYLYPIGPGSRRPLIERLSKEDPHFRMRAIPEVGISELQGLSLTIEAETSRFDYVYSFNDLVDLRGDHYQPKRNLIHQFERNYVFEYLPITSDVIPRVLKMESEWILEHDNPSDGMLEEHQGALRALTDYSILQVFGGALIVDGLVIAYSIGEYITKEVLVVHIEKALKRYKGAYTMINHQLLKHVAPVQFVNFEEDLGLENLAKVKQSYHPIRLEKKYLVFKDR